MNDTSPEMLQRWHAMLDACSPEERVKMSCSMFQFSREIVQASVKSENPSISEKELSRQVFLRFYGTEFSKEQLEHIFAAIDL